MRSGGRSFSQGRNFERNWHFLFAVELPVLTQQNRSFSLCSHTKCVGRRFRDIGDNRTMYLAKAFAHQPQFLAAVAEATGALEPDVVAVTPTLGNDWNGESAVFFQVILADGIPRAQLLPLSRQISQSIVRQVQPLEEWGVLPYFDFVTQSEQARRWA
jgi:hypothetical protein